MHSNTKKWIVMVLFALPIILLLVGVNYIADPGNLFHDFYDELTDAIIAGEEVQILSNNSDEREISKQLIEKMPQEIDCLVLGPSLALTIGQEMTGAKTFYNLAMSSADYYDLLAMIALLNLNDKKVDRMIICFDSRLFDDAVSESDGRHDKLMEYSLYMEDILTKQPSSGKGLKLPKENRTSTLSNLSQLFSISYFQYSVDYLKANGRNVLGERWQVADKNSTAARYLADYSMLYGADQEDTTAEEVIEASRIYWLEANVTEYAYANEDKLATFEKLIQLLQRQGTEIELFLCPFAPALWDRIGEEHYPMLFQLEAKAAELAETYHLKVTGSYNPYKVGLTNEHFYDSRHVKRSAIGEYFDFTSTY